MQVIGLKPTLTLFTPGMQHTTPQHGDAGHIPCALRLTTGRGNVITQQTGWFYNLLTNNLLNAIGTQEFGDVTTYCHIGSGTGTPALGNTALGSFLASTNTVLTSVTSAKSESPYYGRYRRTFRVAAGTGTGTVTEVGLSNQATDGGLMSRALVESISGNPTEIVKRSDEWLDVTYEFRVLPPYVNSDGIGSINAWGSTYTYALRSAKVANSVEWNGQEATARLRTTDYLLGQNVFGVAYNADSVLGAITGEPTSTYGYLIAGNNTNGYTTQEQMAYTQDTFYRDILLLIGPNSGNATGGLGALLIYTYFGSYQIAFSPALPKTREKSLTIGLRFGWRNSDGTT